MELRLDHLLRALRQQPEAILQAIDHDPLLLKKESGGLVLANASQDLSTPQDTHQLFAKGIVYRRQPYRLVSLPLIKIYNLGEPGVTLAELAPLAADPEVQLHYLRKVDGSLIQVFRDQERTWFTTRGQIEGAQPRQDSRRDEEDTSFDYLGAARRLAATAYPALLSEAGLLEGRTLLFELIHPQARKVTSYGERSDLVLVAGFEQSRLRYLSYAELHALAQAHSLHLVDALSPRGQTLPEQIDDLLASLAGTDQEGSVLTFERGGEVIERVKVKSPDYLTLMRTVAECTYERTVALLEANPQVTAWEELEEVLRAQRPDKMPEVLLALFQSHYLRFRAYEEACDRLLRWAVRVCADLEMILGGREEKHPSDFRSSFAILAARYPFSELLLAALDGRLNRARVRQTCRTPDEARRAVAEVAAFDPERF